MGAGSERVENFEPRGFKCGGLWGFRERGMAAVLLA